MHVCTYMVLRKANFFIFQLKYDHDVSRDKSDFRGQCMIKEPCFRKPQSSFSIPLSVMHTSLLWRIFVHEFSSSAVAECSAATAGVGDSCCDAIFCYIIFREDFHF